MREGCLTLHSCTNFPGLCYVISGFLPNEEPEVYKQFQEPVVFTLGLINPQKIKTKLYEYVHFFPLGEVNSFHEIFEMSPRSKRDATVPIPMDLECNCWRGGMFPLPFSRFFCLVEEVNCHETD